MITTEATLTIDRPREVVFAYLADARNEPLWLPGAANVEKTSQGEVGLGTRFVGQYAGAGRVALELVAFDPPAHLTIQGEARYLSFTDDVTLSTDANGATVLRATMRARTRSWWRLMEPLVGATMRKQFAANWPHLERVLGAGASGALGATGSRSPAT